MRDSAGRDGRQGPSDCPHCPLCPTEIARVAQLVERILGKDEVRGSIPRASLVGKVRS